jgi:FMN phosphatase YigB (HAD superfamily)
LQVAPAESIFVGDRLHDDIGGARRVGMRTVLTREFRAEDVDGATEKPDHVVDRLPDLVPYVLRSCQ